MTQRRLGLVGAGLVTIGLVLIVAGSLIDSGPGYGPGWLFGPGGMMGSDGMMYWGPAPTAPAETSVVMAGSRFEPATLTVSVRTTVRWYNDDALPHTVTAVDGS